MADSQHTAAHPGSGDADNSVEMPAPTVCPLLLALGICLVFAGLATSLVLTVVGAVLSVMAGVWWVGQLRPEAGTIREEFVPAAERPRPMVMTLGGVEEMKTGMPGSRLHLPEKMHPYSAGVRGGVVGGLAMTLPAFAYGLVSGHGPWYPINLLAGMLIFRAEDLTPEKLEQFDLLALLLGTVIHALVSVGMGLMYGVLLPMLPGRPIIWGGLVAPLLWTGAMYSFMGVLNPVLQERVYWPAFVASQFVFGLAAGLVVVRSEQVYTSPVLAGPRSRSASESSSPGQPAG